MVPPTTPRAPTIRAPRRHTPIPVGRLFGAGVAAAVTSLLTAVVARTIAVTFLTVDPGFDPLQWTPVLVATLFAAAGATLVYVAVDSFTKRPTRNFLALAALVLLASMIPVLVVAPRLGATPDLQAALAALHTVVAVAVVIPLLRFASVR